MIAKAAAGVSPWDLAKRIEPHTGLKPRSSDGFKKDTVGWPFANSEEVGDIASMMPIAMLAGLCQYSWSFAARFPLWVLLQPERTISETNISGF